VNIYKEQMDKIRPDPKLVADTIEKMARKPVRNKAWLTVPITAALAVVTGISIAASGFLNTANPANTDDSDYLSDETSASATDNYSPIFCDEPNPSVTARPTAECVFAYTDLDGGTVDFTVYIPPGGDEYNARMNWIDGALYRYYPDKGWVRVLGGSFYGFGGISEFYVTDVTGDGIADVCAVILPSGPEETKITNEVVAAILGTDPTNVTQYSRSVVLVYSPADGKCYSVSENKGRDEALYVLDGVLRVHQAQPPESSYFDEGFPLTMDVLEHVPYTPALSEDELNRLIEKYTDDYKTAVGLDEDAASIFDPDNMHYAAKRSRLSQAPLDNPWNSEDYDTVLEVVIPNPRDNLHNLFTMEAYYDDAMLSGDGLFLEDLFMKIYSNYKRGPKEYTIEDMGVSANGYRVCTVSDNPAYLIADFEGNSFVYVEFDQDGTDKAVFDKMIDGAIIRVHE